MTYHRMNVVLRNCRHKALQGRKANHRLFITSSSTGGVVRNVLQHAKPIGSAGLDFGYSKHQLVISNTTCAASQGKPLSLANAVLLGLNTRLHQQRQRSAKCKRQAARNNQCWSVLQRSQSSSRAAHQLHQVQQHVQMVISPLVGHIEPVPVFDFIKPVFAHSASKSNAAEDLDGALVAPGSVSLERQKLFSCLRASRKADVCVVGTRTLSHPWRPTNIRGSAA